MVVIENVPAGSVLSDLGFFCRDEAQQPVHGGILGKVQLSWSRGSKNVVLEEGIVCLPDMPVSWNSHAALYGTAAFFCVNETLLAARCRQAKQQCLCVPCLFSRQESKQ